MRGFINRAALQLVVSFNQIAMLALFVVVFPRTAQNPTAWAAEYFVSIAAITPIFMLFGFEMRKRSAAQELSELDGFNSKRALGILVSVIFSVLVFLVLFFYGLLNAAYIFFSVLIFKVFLSLNDQVSANYEARDNFRALMVSSLLKFGVFSLISVSISIFFEPSLGITLGSIAFIAVWMLYDAREGISVFRWMANVQLNLAKNDWLAGVGSFLIALTISVPRLLAAGIFGETAVNILGVGQSLNRVGQVISNAFTQTIIAVQKKKIDHKSAPVRYVFASQIFIFLCMLALIPLWNWVFSYADTENFSILLGFVLLFGVLSQANYIVQSFILVTRGEAQFASSPIIFFVFFGIIAFGCYLFNAVSFSALLGTMISARLLQIVVNLRRFIVSGKEHVV